MNTKELDDTTQRFRFHGFSREQAIMMAEAINFALEHPDFAKVVGRFGIRHLEDAIASMKLN